MLPDCFVDDPFETAVVSINRSNADSRLSPVPPLCVVSDGVARLETNPLWDRSVLLLRFRELHLRAEGFMARHLDGCRR